MDVLAEELLADAIGEEAAAIGDRGGAEIAEHLPHQIEDRGGFQNHGIAAGRDFVRVVRKARFFGCAAGQRQWIDGGVRYGRSFGPSRAITGHGGDGKLRHAFGVPGGHAARVEDRFRALAGGVNSGGGLSRAFDDADGFGDSMSAMLRRRAGRGWIEPLGFRTHRMYR